MECPHCGAPDQKLTNCENCSRPIFFTSNSAAAHLQINSELVPCPRCKSRGTMRDESDMLVTCVVCGGIGRVAA